MFLRIKKFDDRNCLFLTILAFLNIIMCVSLNAQMNSALGTTNLATGPSEKTFLTSEIENEKKKLLRQKCWLHMKFVSWSIFDLVVMKIGNRQQLHNVVQMLKWKFRVRKCNIFHLTKSNLRTINTLDKRFYTINKVWT